MSSIVSIFDDDSEDARRIREILGTVGGVPGFLAGSLVSSGIGGDDDDDPTIIYTKTGVAGGVTQYDEVDDDFATEIQAWWTDQRGSWTINAGELECTAVTGAATTKAQLICGGMGEFADGWGEVRPTANNNSGFLARWDFDALTGYALFRTTTTNAQLRYVITGVTGSTIGNATIASGDLIGIHCEGDQISIVRNSVIVATFTNTLATNGVWGVHAATVTSRLDNFYCVKL